MATIVKECNGCVIYHDGDVTVLDTPFYQEMDTFKRYKASTENVSYLAEGLEQLHFYKDGQENGTISKNEILAGLVETIFNKVTEKAENAGHRNFNEDEEKDKEKMLEVIEAIVENIPNHESRLRIPNLMKWGGGVPPDEPSLYYDLGQVDLNKFNEYIRHTLENKREITKIKKTFAYSFVFKQYFKLQ